MSQSISFTKQKDIIRNNQNTNIATMFAFPKIGPKPHKFTYEINAPPQDKKGRRYPQTKQNTMEQHTHKKQQLAQHLQPPSNTRTYASQCHDHSPIYNKNTSTTSINESQISKQGNNNQQLDKKVIHDKTKLKQKLLYTHSLNYNKANMG